MTLGRGLKITCAGLLVGLAGSLATMDLLKGYLFGVSARDPFTLSAAMLVLLLASLMACWWPVRRALRMKPMEALRYE